MQTPVYDSAKNTNAKTGSTGSTSTSHASTISCEHEAPHEGVEGAQGHHHPLPAKDVNPEQLSGHRGQLQSLSGTSGKDKNVDYIWKEDNNVNYYYKKQENVNVIEERKEITTEEENTENNEEMRKKKEAKKIEPCKDSSSSSSSLSSSSCKLASEEVGTNLLPIVPEVVHGRPGMPPWPDCAATPPPSPSTACGGRPSATGLLATPRGERGEVQGISDVGRKNTLFGNVKGKFATNFSGISAGGKTTGEGRELYTGSKVKGRVDTICGTGQGFSRPTANHPRGILNIIKNIPKSIEDQ